MTKRAAPLSVSARLRRPATIKLDSGVAVEQLSINRMVEVNFIKKYHNRMEIQGFIKNLTYLQGLSRVSWDRDAG
jgi:hypothetical protein